MAGIDGNPGINLNLNASGTGPGGEVHVQDNGTNVLKIDENGRIFTGGTRALLLEGTQDAPFVTLSNGTKPIDFKWNNTSGVHTMESQEKLRLKADEFQLETNTLGTGDHTIWSSGSTPVLKLHYDSTGKVVSLVQPQSITPVGAVLKVENSLGQLMLTGKTFALEASGTTGKVEAINDLENRSVTGIVRTTASASGEGEIGRFRRGDDDRLLVETESAMVRITTLEESQELLTDVLELRGKLLHLVTDQASAKLVEYRWSDNATRMHLEYDSTDEEVRFVTEHNAQSPQVDFVVWSGHSIEMRLDRTESGSIENFTVSKGHAGGNPPSLFRVLYDGRTTFYYPLSSGGSQEMAQFQRTASSGMSNAALRLGENTAYRGLLGLQADTINSRCGVANLQDETGDDYYHWVTTDGLLRRSDDPASPDPGTDDGDGYYVNDGPLDVKTLTSSSVTVNKLECGTVLTNDGASAGVTFNLPTPEVGLQFTFVNRTTHGLTIDAGTSNTIIAGGVSDQTVTASGDDGQAIRLVCVDSTTWQATQVVGSWS